MKKTIEELIRERKEYDEKYWEHKSSREEWVDHMLWHIGKAAGKVCTYAEELHHKGGNPSPEIMIKEVAPDLIVYSLQLLNLYPKLKEMIDTRVTLLDVQKGHNHRNLSPAILTLKSVRKLLIKAEGELEAENIFSPTRSYRALQTSGSYIANLFKQDLNGLYERRLIAMASLNETKKKVHQVSF
ncbi:hypothetical protein A3B18_01650 [Candidatus Giovannonibacteria bacterium RIFCSPLOWO2_01_FULL_46_13]|uniref:Uncharacterized protein n=1 Tax=Candidatus Giovannonibacteria bacterium RIFCSPLOWO2_01_FULL_46_13 TaxID=1798352 RepID=A0A1F5X5E2_9BACT|nr:MAG: hypothetical protein A3B18_01650 [Candidatus Giovannonibacteria bacterium RIFCSPLOWO2_01_FULL_46_13]